MTTVSPKAVPTPVEHIAGSIIMLRGHRVILDTQLAQLYGVDTKRLNQQVRRNRHRFPPDFLLELTAEEVANLKLHFATSSWGGRRKLPFAFTEHGAIQVATILSSPRAVEISVYVVRAFVKLREILASNHDLARQLKTLEERLTRRADSHDQAITGILKTIRELMQHPKTLPRKRRPIGFTANLDETSED